MDVQGQQHRFVQAESTLAGDVLLVYISEKYEQITEGCRGPAVDCCTPRRAGPEIVAEKVSFEDYKNKKAPKRGLLKICAMSTVQINALMA